jgi:4-amino-4-deoxy-L-arabinose transferase-like glycosyltransferase
MFIAAVAVAVAWMVVIRLRAVDPGATPLDDRFFIKSLGFTQFWSEISSGVWMGWVTSIYVPESWVAAWYSLAGVMLTSVSILPIFASGRDRRPAVTFGTAALTCLLLSGPLFVVVNFVLSHAWVPIPPRYAASVIPFGLVGMAHLTRTASKDRLVQGAAAVGLVGIFTTLFAVV